MRLFHVSEDGNIELFIPRFPTRDDIDKSVGLVWAIYEKRLPNYLLPRDCPRVTYHIGENTSNEDIEKYFSCKSHKHTIVIESKWFEIMQNTTLYIYEFDTADFVLQDDIAGYYVSTREQTPIAKYTILNAFNELFSRNVELHIVDNLWEISDKIKETTLNWSICRMGFALPRKES